MRLVLPSKVSGLVAAPPSKSHSQRLMLNSLFTHEAIRINTLSLCDDSKIILNFLKSVGKRVEQQETQISISGKWKLPEEIIELGESGFAARVLPIIMLAKNGKVAFTGNPNLFKRPLNYLSSIAEELGACIQVNPYSYKIIKFGIAQNLSLEYDDSISSQYLTAVLYLFSLSRNYEAIHLKLLKSNGYIDLTLQSLKEFGIKYIRDTNFIKLNSIEQVSSEFSVEGDWSAAAFFMVLGALLGDLRISNLKPDSHQPDRMFYNLLEKIGVNISSRNNNIIFTHSNVSPFDYDASGTPDLVPALVPLAAKLPGKSTIRGVERLKYKESNRIEVLVEEYKKLGVKIYQNNDQLIIIGNKIIGGTVDSHNDHRLAMSFAIAGILSEDGVYINNHDCVNKSYPNFFDDLQNLNVEIK